jgi:hypothetical protein
VPLINVATDKERPHATMGKGDFSQKHQVCEKINFGKIQIIFAFIYILFIPHLVFYKYQHLLTLTSGLA